VARELAAETERLRQLPDELVSRLRDSGLLRAGAPLEVGGLELAPGLALRCAEEIARGDASAGWCVSIAITSSLLAAYLPAESRTELFGDERGVAAGVWAPRGKARPVDGGLLVSGRWAFCSGIAHSDLLFAGCFVEEGADTAGERPTPSVAAVRKQDLEVRDTWHTLGLRGTGSQDCVADDVFIPAARVFSLFDGPLLDRPLYRFPIFGFFALSIAAAALGQGRHGVHARARRALTHPCVGRHSRGVAPRRKGLLPPGNRRQLAGGAARRARPRPPAERASPGGHPRRPDIRRGRPVDV
jgi:indole-3-acetate monooxygenase